MTARQVERQVSSFCDLEAAVARRDDHEVKRR